MPVALLLAGKERTQAEGMTRVAIRIALFGLFYLLFEAPCGLFKIKRTFFHKYIFCRSALAHE
jgi:hypothetical protein